jgi:hypothetical protein
MACEDDWDDDDEDDDWDSDEGEHQSEGCEGEIIVGHVYEVTIDAVDLADYVDIAQMPSKWRTRREITIRVRVTGKDYGEYNCEAVGKHSDLFSSMQFSGDDLRPISH